MKISMYLRKHDEAEEQLVDEWEGDKALSNIGYYMTKNLEPNCSIRIDVTDVRKPKKLRRIKDV